MTKLFCYDLETTGTLVNKHGIHQISGAIIFDGVIKEEFDIRVQPNPKALIDPIALKVCNVTEDQISKYMTMQAGYRKLTGILSKYVDKFNKKDKLFLVGYNNASFDDSFLRAFFIQNGDKYFGSNFWADALDVRVLAANYLRDERRDMENFKLATVAKHLGINVDEEKLHDAQYDIYLTMAILDIINSKVRLTI
jgi:DNA polymerase-3 subunit epsilon